MEASREGVRAVKVSLIALGLTALLQAGVVAVSGSVALLGDTLHNVADALTALPLWMAFTIGRRAPTRRYTYGYGRAEDLPGVFIVAMITLSAVVAAWESAQRLVEPRGVARPGLVILASLIGFIGNEGVATYRIRVGRRIGSAALVADGLHARTDGLTSLAVLAGTLGVMAGFLRADPVAGLLITLAILVVLGGAAREVWWRLMDAVDPSLVDRAVRVLTATDGIEDFGEVRVRWLGHRLSRSPGGRRPRPRRGAGPRDRRAGSHRLLHELPRLSDALVHIDPCGHDGSDPHARTAHHRERESS